MTAPSYDQGFLARTFASLHSRNFRLFFYGQTVSQTGNWLTMVALTLLVYHRTESGLAVGLLTACQFGPCLLLSPLAGVLIDRTDKRKLLLVTQALSLVESVVLAALAFMHTVPLAAFFVTATAGGCLLAFDNPVRRSFVNEMVPARDIANAVTVYSAMANLSRIAGPALAGLLVVSVGYGWCFAIDAASYLTVLVALWMMRSSELHRAPVTPRGPGQIRAAVRYVAQVPDLWVTFAMLFIVGTISYNFNVLFPLFVEESLHGSDAAYTIVYSAFSVGALLGALAVARRRIITIRTVAGGALILGVTMCVLAAAPTVPIAVAIAVTVGAGSVAYMTATTAIAQLRTEPNFLGRVMALQAVLLIGTAPLGSLALGALSDAYGARVPVIVGGVAALGAAAFGVLADRQPGWTPADMESTADSCRAAGSAATAPTQS
jgi:MFS family permease